MRGRELADFGLLTPATVHDRAQVDIVAELAAWVTFKRAAGWIERYKAALADVDAEQAEQQRRADDLRAKMEALRLQGIDLDAERKKNAGRDPAIDGRLGDRIGAIDRERANLSGLLTVAQNNLERCAGELERLKDGLVEWAAVEQPDGAGLRILAAALREL